MPKIEPAILSFLSEEFLSVVNPFLLQAEIAAAILLGIGIVYESDKYPESVHESAFWFVVIGVVLETVFSIMLFASEERVASIQRADLKSAASQLEATTKTAMAATERAAKAETDAANLMKENVELERALAPRTIDNSEFTRAVSRLPRLPIFIEPIDSEEPKQVASALAFWLHAVQYADTPTWNVTKALSLCVRGHKML
jgi:septal ring factor EnvC (AmiA/AmiB activator)